MGYFSELDNYKGSDKDLRHDYFSWLQEKVGGDIKADSYYFLFGRLFDTTFFWFIDMDKNRALDGIRLRSQYVVDNYYGELTPFPEGLGACSVLEMLVALAIRIEDNLFESDEDDRTSVWFWEMLTNLGLDKFNDEDYDSWGGDRVVDEILEFMMQRKYCKNGSKGGLFPLKYSRKDQRKIEIWYQMNEYLLENYYDS